MMTYRTCQMRFAKPDATVNEKRIVFFARPVAYRECRGMSELVARADDEFVKRETWIEFRIKWALLHVVWPRLRFHGFRGLRLTKGYAALNTWRFARLVGFGHNDLGLDG